MYTRETGRGTKSYICVCVLSYGGIVVFFWFSIISSCQLGWLYLHIWDTKYTAGAGQRIDKWWVGADCKTMRSTACNEWDNCKMVCRCVCVFVC